MRDNWQKNNIYEIYQKAKFGQIKADIFRYCILYDRGGYYFDISKGCKMPLTELHHKDTEALLCNEPQYSTTPPNHKTFNLLSNLKCGGQIIFSMSIIIGGCLYYILKKAVYFSFSE